MAPWLKYLFYTTASVITSEIMYYLYKYFKPKPPPKEIHEVLFFSSPPLPCFYHPQGDQYCHPMKCGNVKLLVEYFKQARYDLDVCIYMLTNYDISNAIYLAHVRGLKVRIIADADMAFGQGSQVRALLERGVPVRVKKSQSLMHHKFAVVDRRRNVNSFVITGSLNWTMQGISRNWENVVVTSQPILVTKFSDEFERLWNEFEPKCA